MHSQGKLFNSFFLPPSLSLFFLRPPPCHKIWMSRKVICVCWEMKCSTGLKTYCICLEICFPGRTSGVSEREAAACVSSKRERGQTLSSLAGLQCAPLPAPICTARLHSDARQMFLARGAKYGEGTRARAGEREREAEE